ncbi:MAG: UDP-2,3-diacylglucosamine diphosphatase [Methanothrix sp.]|nr:UDP-2,3-diacylglucosamine diphosphatase [Methanothrix sp.]
MIVVVSDVHLGSDVGRKSRGTGHASDDLDLDPLFQTFMGHIGKEYLHTGEDRLILLGDIFDFWRKDAGEVLIKNHEAVSKMKEISQRSMVNYVVGNHDYSIRDMWEKAGTKSLFHSMDRSLHLEIDGEPFTFIHGHQLEVLANPYNKSEKLYNSISELLCDTAGVTRSTAGALWSFIDSEAHRDYMKSMKKPATERLIGKHNAIDAVESLAQSKSRTIYTGSNSWLVYGHTHRGYVDEATRTANTGSWGRNGDESLLDCMIIENGRPKLTSYEI